MSCDRYVKLNTGAMMPLMGYGTWLAVGDELEKSLEVALELGYRHIDTATVYQNESAIGCVLNKWLTENKIQREDIFITTKLPAYANRPELVFKYLDESLRQLQLDYIDMYLIHAPFGILESLEQDDDGNYLVDLTTDHIALWKKMEEAVDAGKTKAIGLSNFNEKQIERILQNCRIPPANLQIELHVYLQQEPMVELCRQHNIAVTSYCSLGSEGLFNTLFVYKDVVKLMDDEVIQAIADKHGKLAPQVLLRFWIQQDIVIIPKSSNPKHIKSNFEIFDFNLDDEDMAKIKTLDKGEEGRIFIFKDIYKGAEKHPEYTF